MRTAPRAQMPGKGTRDHSQAPSSEKLFPLAGHCSENSWNAISSSTLFCTESTGTTHSPSPVHMSFAGYSECLRHWVAFSMHTPWQTQVSVEDLHEIPVPLQKRPRHWYSDGQSESNRHTYCP